MVLECRVGLWLEADPLDLTPDEEWLEVRVEDLTGVVPAGLAPSAADLR